MKRSLLRSTQFALYCLGLLTLIPSEAAAHLVSTGMGPVYDGIGHLFLTPEDLIPTLGVALLGGLRGPATSRALLFCFPLAWLGGGIVGLGGSQFPAFPLEAAAFIMVGIFVATDLKIPRSFILLLTLPLAMLHGYLNGIVMKTGPGLPGLLGITGALFVLLALVSAIVLSLERYWMRIGVRVLGSWITAVGMLMIGLHYGAATG